MDLSFYCEDLFGRRVEIVTPNILSPYLGPRILAELEYVVVWDVDHNKVPVLRIELERILAAEDRPAAEL